MSLAKDSTENYTFSFNDKDKDSIQGSRHQSMPITKDLNSGNKQD